MSDWYSISTVLVYGYFHNSVEFIRWVVINTTNILKTHCNLQDQILFATSGQTWRIHNNTTYHVAVYVLMTVLSMRSLHTILMY